MTGLLLLFGNNLLPVFLAAGAGFLLSRLLHVQPRTLSQVVFYIFSPCLIFALITRSELHGGEIFRVMVFTWLLGGILAGIALAIGYAVGLHRRMIAAVVLTTMFMNAGNFGLSVTWFAFGDNALAVAAIYFVASAIMVYTIGILIASLGSTGVREAMRNLLKVPMVYALILAVLFLMTGWTIPVALERTVNLLADAAIPGMLVLLGLQLQQVQWRGQLLPMTITGAIRLVISPGIAIGLALLFGFQDVVRQATVLEASMPTAVITTVLATEYDVEPSFVTAAVFITTVLSPLTITPLLSFLGN